MKFTIFVLIVFWAMYYWNHKTVDPSLNAPAAKPANVAHTPVAHEPTLAESMSKWLVDHSSSK